MVVLEVAMKSTQIPLSPAPEASSPETRLRMKRQPMRNTQCEMAVRRVLHASGLRYRVDTYPLKNLNRRADIVFRRCKVAIFIDGRFWHGCTEHKSPPKNNTDWWIRKIQTNSQRDLETDSLLKLAGWRVLRAWEHEDPQKVAAEITTMVSKLD